VIRRPANPALPLETRPLRIVHLSDIHLWQYTINPIRYLSKRMLGMASLVLGRASRFRLERLPELVNYVQTLRADHILITGDLTTTALPGEFRAARAGLADWLGDPARATIIPGNHDRYTLYAHHSRRFERYFGDFSPQRSYPWLRKLDADTAILGLDPTRSGISASGKLPRDQLIRAREILANAGPIARLVIACHYPVAVPPRFEREYAHKPLVDRAGLMEWLRAIGSHIYCCGHVHAAWAYQPQEVPGQLSLNAGAPLLRDKTGLRPPGFLEITLDGYAVIVRHHSWTGDAWAVRILFEAEDFFGLGPVATD
jgi:3',5'-cyclic AMP phosphodiesterase CpdA